MSAAVLMSSLFVLGVLGIRSATIMGLRLAMCGTVLPAAAILSVTLLAAIHPRLQGLLITITGMGLFIVAMQLIPRLKYERLNVAQAAA